MKSLDNKINKIGDEIKEYVEKGSKISLISSYISIYAFKELQREVEKVSEFRVILSEPLEGGSTLLGGIDVKGLVSGNEFETKFKNNLDQTYIGREFGKWLREKVSIKGVSRNNIVGSKFIHIKNSKKENLVINNTNDFSASGLGFTESNQIMFANSIEDKEITKMMLNQFDMLWENEQVLKDVKEEILKTIEKIYKDNTPEYLYFVTLYNVFKTYLEELTDENIVKSKTGFKDTIIWNKLYKFQKDGVLGSIDKLEKYNGCIIADSVGLGKTFSALAIVKYYELRNHRVLVLCPKKLRDNWLVYTQNDKRNILAKDRLNYDVLNHTDLSRDKGKSGDIDLSTINWSNYDLVVIDESHNFRNNAARNNSETRYSKLMKEVIKKGVKTKVLMLSATPVNNRMNDIKNQIAFITEGTDNAFIAAGIRSIEQTLKKAQTIFNKWSEGEEEERTLDNFLESMNSDYFKLLDLITIARSRKHIEKYYNVREMGKFPKRETPLNIKSDIDISGEFPKLEEINKEIMRLKLAAYSPLKYVLLHKKEEYNEKYDITVRNGSSVFKQTDREASIVHLMRASMLKRMESSIQSFGLTIKKILEGIDGLLNKIESNEGEYDSSLNINNIDIDDSNVDDLLIGNKVKVLMQDIDKVRWKQDLEFDKERLQNLLAEAYRVIYKKDDAKLIKLKEVLRDKLENPLNKTNKKVLVFTAFADTAVYLYENIEKWVLQEYGLYTALVTGAGANKTSLKESKTDLNGILTNFSPRSKEREKMELELNKEIDILIATDCISEGQNLQDCDFLINYDIHWNPVRIIQRFGRIDRIGSINERIKLVNFWPNMELDEYINLEARVSGRMVLLDISATGEENIISFDEKKKMNDLEYRKKQLKKLQEEVVDLEDINGGISITDLTLNDFKMDLMEALERNKEEIKTAPQGIYSIINIPKEFEGIIKRGVIFCLKELKDNNIKTTYNSLHPYYLVYVSEEGEVVFNHGNSKKILDFYKKLCSGKGEVLKELVDSFNDETLDGELMNTYARLLEKGIESIIGRQEEEGIMSLFSTGGTNIQGGDLKALQDFGVITYLIIR